MKKEQQILWGIGIAAVIAALSTAAYFIFRKSKLDANGFPINPKEGDVFTKGTLVYTFSNGSWIVSSNSGIPSGGRSSSDRAIIANLNNQYMESLEQQVSGSSRVPLNELAARRISINNELCKYGMHLTYELNGDGITRDDTGTDFSLSPILTCINGSVIARNGTGNNTGLKCVRCCCVSGLLGIKKCCWAGAAGCNACECSVSQ